MRPTLTVLVYTDSQAAKALRAAGAGREDAIRLIERDLGAELGSALAVHAAATTVDFERRARAAAARVAAAHGVLAAQKNVRAVEQRLRVRGEAGGPALDAALARLDRALRQAERALARRRNLARLACGVVGIRFDGAEVYGGATWPGERWSEAFVGALPRVFPPRAALAAKRVGALDFGSPAFDPYRDRYSAAMRRQLALQSVANTAREQIALAFGLRPKEGKSGELLDRTIDLERAQHFARDSAPARLTIAEQGALVQRLRAHLRSCP